MVILLFPHHPVAGYLHLDQCCFDVSQNHGESPAIWDEFSHGQTDLVSPLILIVEQLGAVGEMSEMTIDWLKNSYETIQSWLLHYGAGIPVGCIHI